MTTNIPSLRFELDKSKADVTGSRKEHKSVGGPAEANHKKSTSTGDDFWPVIFSGQMVLFLWSFSALVLVRAWSEMRECRRIPYFPEIHLWISGSPVQKSKDATLDSGDATLESGSESLDSLLFYVDSVLFCAGPGGLQ